MTSPDQVAELTSGLAGCELVTPPAPIAVDQEGGQLSGLDRVDEFAGNMAFGSRRRSRPRPTGGCSHGRRARRSWHQRELRPGRRRRHSCRTTRRWASARLVTTQNWPPGSPAPWCRVLRSGSAGHSEAFSGSGEATVDPHYRSPLLDLDRDRLEQVELPPSRGAGRRSCTADGGPPAGTRPDRERRGAY